MCTLRLDPSPPLGQTLHGSCGERLLFGVNEILEEPRIPSGACEEFRREALRAFGAGGPRRIGAQFLPTVGSPARPESLATDEAFDGWGGLGRRPLGAERRGF